jgi:hypothetical protein
VSTWLRFEFDRERAEALTGALYTIDGLLQTSITYPSRPKAESRKYVANATYFSVRRENVHHTHVLQTCAGSSTTFEPGINLETPRSTNCLKTLKQLRRWFPMRISRRLPKTLLGGFLLHISDPQNELARSRFYFVDNFRRIEILLRLIDWFLFL